MKKILIYSAVAVVLGLLLTLVPLFTLAEFKAENVFVSSQMKNLERADSVDATKYSAVGFEILAISFIVAFVAYVLLRWKTLH